MAMTIPLDDPRLDRNQPWPNDGEEMLLQPQPVARMPYPSISAPTAGAGSSGGLGLRLPAPRGTETNPVQALAKSAGIDLSQFTTPGAGPASLPPIAYPDTSAGVDAAFARGKDKAAANARASVRGLTEAMAARGILGSGIEAAGTGAIVGRAGQGVNELIREQSIQDANLAQQRAAQEYQGRIQQRGQDIGVAQENARRQTQALESLLNLAGLLY